MAWVVYAFSMNPPTVVVIQKMFMIITEIHTSSILYWYRDGCDTPDTNSTKTERKWPRAPIFPEQYTLSRQITPENWTGGEYTIWDDDWRALNPVILNSLDS